MKRSRDSEATEVSPAQALARMVSIIDSTMESEVAWPFNAPVDPIALDIPTYNDIITKPMDLGTIRAGLNTPTRYEYVHQVVADVKLVFSNCYTFNNTRSEVAVMARTTNRHFDKFFRRELGNVVLDGSKFVKGQGLKISDTADSSSVPVAAPVKRTSMPNIPDSAINDSICAICERDGNILCCDGPCLQSFHVVCTGMTSVPDDAKWFCQACAAQVHECFACKEVGVDGIEVMQCSHVTCGRFYHPECVMDLAQTVKKSKFQGAGKFVCPLHECALCRKQGKLATLSKCFRCPVAFHHECIPLESLHPPSDEAEEEEEEEEEVEMEDGETEFRVVKRARRKPEWVSRLSNIYIICQKHHSKVKLGIAPEEQLDIMEFPEVPEAPANDIRRMLGTLVFPDTKNVGPVLYSGDATKATMVAKAGVITPQLIQQVLPESMLQYSTPVVE